MTHSYRLGRELGQAVVQAAMVDNRQSRLPLRLVGCSYVHRLEAAIPLPPTRPITSGRYIPRRIGQIGDDLPGPLAPSNGHCLNQWTTSDFEQLDQLKFGERPALPSRVGLLVGSGDQCEWVADKPARFDSSIRKGDHSGKIGVSCSSAHLGFHLSTEPTLDRFPRQISKAIQPAVSSEAIQQSSHVGAMLATSSLGFMVFEVRCEMSRQRRRLMVGDRVLGRSHHAGFHQLGALFQIGQYALGCGLVSTAGCDFANHARAIAVLSGVRAGDDQQPIGPVGTRSDRFGSRSPLGIFEPGESLAFADEQLSIGRQRLSEGFAVDSTHWSISIE